VTALHQLQTALRAPQGSKGRLVVGASTSLDRRSENVRILPVIISELKLGDIERHIFAAHFVECADHAALEDRPKAFNRVGMDCADNVLASSMINSRVWIVLIERIVGWILIGTKQADSVRHRFADERGENGGIHVRDYPRNVIPLAADSADDWRFAGANAASPAASAAFIPMPIFGQAAGVGARAHSQARRRRRDRSWLDSADVNPLTPPHQEPGQTLHIRQLENGLERPGGRLRPAPRRLASPVGTDELAG
jgi:hypothetical protein